MQLCVFIISVSKSCVQQLPLGIYLCCCMFGASTKLQHVCLCLSCACPQCCVYTGCCDCLLVVLRIPACIGCLHAGTLQQAIHGRIVFNQTLLVAVSRTVIVAVYTYSLRV